MEDIEQRHYNKSNPMILHPFTSKKKKKKFIATCEERKDYSYYENKKGK